MLSLADPRFLPGGCTVTVDQRLAKSPDVFLAEFYYFKGFLRFLVDFEGFFKLFG